MTSSYYYYDKEKGEMVEGFPELNYDIYDKAPGVIQDSIPAYKHPATGLWTESRKALSQMDDASGTITTDKRIEADSYNQRMARAKLEKDRADSLKKAVEQVKSGNSPFTDDQRQVFKTIDKAFSKKGFVLM